MREDIISYREVCDRENIQTLQRGMNFRLNDGYSVILMSQRSNAPYQDRVLDDGITIEYEGHDVPRARFTPEPKRVDQPRFFSSGTSTQNGLFADAVDRFKKGEREAEVVHVYEKIHSGVWSDRGFFRLVDYTLKSEGGRTVFKFYLRFDSSVQRSGRGTSQRRIEQQTRLIPSDVKKEVWKRDGGKCVLCGATDNLHFDHDIPYSKGGTSVTSQNVRILCARHNLQKRDKIE